MTPIVDMIKTLVQDNHKISVVLDNGDKITVNHFDDFKDNIVCASCLTTDSFGTRKVSYYINCDKISYIADR